MSQQADVCFVDKASDSPVSPTGDPNGLDDVDRHLEEKDKEEEEETEGAVRPDKGKETKQHKGDINIVYMYDNEILDLMLKHLSYV